MRAEAVRAIIDGLKEAGVNFVGLMPDSEFRDVQEELRQDPHIKTISVSNEGTGVAVCAGAWLAGKVPALLIPTSGLLVATWPLTSLCMAFGIPIILVIPYRGEIGDGHWVMRPYQFTTRPALDMLQIPYSTVGHIDQVKEAIKATRRSATGWLSPVGLLLTGEVIW